MDTPEEKKKSAAAEKLRGAGNISPHISLMYRLIDHTSSASSSKHQPLNYLGPDGSAAGTKIICRGDIFPTFCACTPFLVSIAHTN